MSIVWIFLHVCGALGFAVVMVYGTPTEPIRRLSLSASVALRKVLIWLGMPEPERPPNGLFGLLIADLPENKGMHFGCPWCFGTSGAAAWGALIAVRSWLPQWICAAHDVAAFAFTVSLLGFFVASLVGAIERANARLKRTTPKAGDDNG